MSHVVRKGSMHKKDITSLNAYAPNNRASTYMQRQLIELKEGKTNKYTVTVGDLSTSLSAVDRPPIND